MPRYYRLTVARKLVLAFSLVSLLWAVLCLISFQSLKSMQRTYSELLNRQVAGLTMAKDIQYNVEIERNALVAYMNNINNGAIGDVTSAKRLKDANAEVDRLAKLSVIFTDSKYQTIIEKIKTLNEQFKTEATADMQMMDTNMSQAVVLAKTNIEPITNLMIAHTNDMVSRQMKRMNEQEALTTNNINKTIWALGAASLAVFLASIAGGYMYARRMAKPIVRMAAMTKEIASGNLKGHLSKHRAKDEIGLLSNHFQMMSDNLRELIEKIAETSTEIGRSVSIMENNTEGTKLASKHIVVAMKIVQDAVGRQSNHFDDTENSTREVVKGIQQITELAKHTFEQAVQMERSATRGTREMEDTSEQMRIIGASIKSLHESVQKTNAKTEQIGMIVEVISSISKKTQILALNASIEASRVGAQGKGFVVIAEEIRKLSQQTSESAHHIRDFVNEMIIDARTTSKSTEICYQESSQGLSSVERAKSAFNKMRKTFETFSVQMGQITTSVEEIDQLILAVRDAIVYIQEMSRTTLSKTQEVSSATEQQLVSMEEMVQFTTLLGQLAQQLQRTTSRFQW